LIDSWCIHTEKENAAEAWVLSCHPAGESKVKGGPFDGQTLREILCTHPAYLGTHRAGPFPLLVKLIDARDDLSIQAHPTSEYCARTGGGQPKTECWLILDCEPGAQLVMGFREDGTPERVRQSLADNTFMNLVNYVPVHPGDFFFIPAGTLHAIGKGILLAEIQQSSDTTYRLFDYNRPGMDGKPRPLHIEEALGCLDTKAIKNPQSVIHNNNGTLCVCPEFTVKRLLASAEGMPIGAAQAFRALLVLDGGGSLEQGSEALRLDKGACVFLPANSGEYLARGEMDLLIVEP
jgi:mannose-6-phosphate isomerase